MVLAALNWSTPVALPKRIVPLLPSAPLLPKASTPSTSNTPPPKVFVPVRLTVSLVSLVSSAPEPARLAPTAPLAR